MMTLSRVYGFWKYVTNLERDETRRYLDMFYGLLLRKLSREVKNRSSNQDTGIEEATPHRAFA